MRVSIILFLFSIAISCKVKSQNDLGAYIINDKTVGIVSTQIDGNPIAGLEIGNPKYKASNFKINEIVKNRKEFLLALKKSVAGSVIYISDTAVIDLTGEQKISIVSGVTIASGRGLNGSPGAILFTKLNGTNPLFNITENKVRISGLRIMGPDSSIYTSSGPKTKQTKFEDTSKFVGPLREYYKKMYTVPVSSGIKISGDNVEIENCEIAGWSFAGIRVNKNSNVTVHHCYIHHNLRFGLGYGVVVNGGNAKILANLFDNNGHSVTSTGIPTSNYEISYNIFKENHIRGWPIDMHGGTDRKDGTTIAGNKLLIHHNVIRLFNRRQGIVIRGVPKTGAYIYNNDFVYLTSKAYLEQYRKKGQEAKSKFNLTLKERYTESDVIQQKNASGNFWVSGNIIREEK